jgi:hypothetical protein
VLRAGALAAAVALAAGYAWRPDPVLLFWGAMAVLAAGLAVTLRADDPRVRPAPVSPGAEAALWLLALACAALALLAHRADTDDGFYVNLAVAAAEAPRRALLSADTVHGVPGLPLHLPVYRVHSWELLNGAVAYLTGLPALAVFHGPSAALAALLVPLAHARLFRALGPGAWPGAVAVLLAVLLAAGETNDWYGNLALLRIWQGKPLFLVVLLPLVYAYALAFSARPTLRGWLLLAAAQVAAVGATSSALWAAPAGALLGLAAALRPSRPGLATAAAGALASSYVLGAAWLVRRSVGGLVAGAGAAGASGGPEPASLVHHVLVTTLGDGRLLVAGLAVLAGAWAVAPRGPARRFAVVAALAAFLGPLDPYAFTWLHANLLGPTYWRAMWAVPLPILITLVLTAPLHLGGHRWPPARRALACAALVAAFVLLVPRQGALGPGNAVRLGWPGLKVPPVEYRWAALVNRSVPPGSPVAVPPELAWLVVVTPGHAHPLDVKGYVRRHAGRLGADAVQDRLFVQEALARPEMVERQPARFREALARFGVRAAGLPASPAAGPTRAILAGSGFRQAAGDEDYELWVRDGGTGTAGPGARAGAPAAPGGP